MLSYRKFNKETDYDIMRKIARYNCSEIGHLAPQVHIGNLDFERYAFEESPDIVYETTWFVTELGREIGFITVEESEYYITVLSGFEHTIKEIVEYVEGNCFAAGMTITTDANSEDQLFSSLLEKRGYKKTENYGYKGICDLSKIPPNTALPKGFSIRITEKADLQRRAELFDLATGSRGTTPERYENMMNSPSYSDALDLVVQTDGGEIIAYCTIWDDPVSKISILEPVACVAEYRRRGIMKSTLLYGMHRVKERGSRYMYVGTGGKNIASQTLYKSVGFVEYGKNCEWGKRL